MRYDGKRVVVTGCASGIGAQVARQLGELGARVTGLDRPRADRIRHAPDEFIEIDLADPDSVDAAAAAVGRPVDALFNVAGVSSGIGDPLLVVRINFLGMRQFTEALVERMMPPARRSSTCPRWRRRPTARTHGTTAGLVRHHIGRRRDFGGAPGNPDALADGGYRLSKEAIILYGMHRAADLGARGIRINCTAPGVTETPILDQLRSAYGQQYLDSFTAPLGRVSTPRNRPRRWSSWAVAPPATLPGRCCGSTAEFWPSGSGHSIDTAMRNDRVAQGS